MTFIKNRSGKGGFSPRRRALLALVVIVLLVMTWMSWVGVAGLSGISTRDMDWNGDGQVTSAEIAQSYYAVVVEKTTNGNRQCTNYRWRRTGESIRVECKTVVQPSTPTE